LWKVGQIEVIEVVWNDDLWSFAGLPHHNATQAAAAHAGCVKAA
jgi:hypothetical protein